MKTTYLCFYSIAHLELHGAALLVKGEKAKIEITREFRIISTVQSMNEGNHKMLQALDMIYIGNVDMFLPFIVGQVICFPGIP